MKWSNFSMIESELAMLFLRHCGRSFMQIIRRALSQTPALIIVVCVISSNISTAYAAGFSIGEQGAGALGVGGAATARGDLGSAGFYNPAAWGFASRLEAAVGVSAISASIAHVDPASGGRTEAITDVETPPYAHVGFRFGDFAAGVSFDVPFGSGLRWPTDWRGRFDVTGIRLQVLELAGTLVWRATDEFAIAAGPRLAFATVEYLRRIDAVDSEGRVHLTGDATGVGAQLAALYRLTDRLSLGLSYRSRIGLDFTGQADFEDIPIELKQKAHDQRVETEVTVPDRIALGVAWEVGRATASFDAIYWTWSTFQEFAIDFEDEDTPDVSQHRGWHDSVTLRAGWEQRGLVDDLALRAGVAFDQTPSPSDTLSPSLPDGSRLMPTVGLGYTALDGLQINLAYAHVFFLGATATGDAFPGDYDASAHILSLGVDYDYGVVEP
jgi:long-chain fatty acid transport protein